MATAISAQSVTSRKKGAMKRTILILLGWMLLSQGCSYGVDDPVPPVCQAVTLIEDVISFGVKVRVIKCDFPTSVVTEMVDSG